MKQIQSLVEKHGLNHSLIARAIGVEPSTISNWLHGQSIARPKSLDALTKLCEQYDHIFDKSCLDKQLRDSIDIALKEIRETLHRRTKLSNRNDVLEEICKILLCQILSLKHDHFDLCSIGLLDNDKVAIELNNKCKSVISNYLPPSILKELSLDDFHLRLKDNENILAIEILKAVALINWSDVQGIIDVDFLNEVFGKFLSDNFSQEKQLGQYLTPIEMIRFMVDSSIQSIPTAQMDVLLDPNNCHEFGYVLDPSCGVGSFLIEFVKALSPRVKYLHGDDGLELWLSNMSENVLFAIDKSERMIKLAISNFCLSGLECKNIHNLNSLSLTEHNDVLIEQLEGNVGLILTNPPFGAEFKGADLKGYKLVNRWSSKEPSKVDSEILFVERYIDWLKPNGICSTVLPDSVLFNRKLFRDLRNGIKDDVDLMSVVSFPSKTFAISGTSAKTSSVQFIKSSNKSGETFFAICDDLGFDVATKSTHRVRVNVGLNEIPLILNCFANNGGFKNAGWKQFNTSSYRWDATYHSFLSNDMALRLRNPSDKDVTLTSVVDIISLRCNVKNNDGTFQYIEISDIDAQSCNVRAKTVQCSEAPSRARKVVQKGDVLVSTVRPEQRKVGVVPDYLDGAICTTGLVVLRSKVINPLSLAEIIKSDFVVMQLLRNNVGVSYPSVDESIFEKLILPVNVDSIMEINELASEVKELIEELRVKQSRLREVVSLTL